MRQQETKKLVRMVFAAFFRNICEYWHGTVSALRVSAESQKKRLAGRVALCYFNETRNVSLVIPAGEPRLSYATKRRWTTLPIQCWRLIALTLPASSFVERCRIIREFWHGTKTLYQSYRQKDRNQTISPGSRQGLSDAPDLAETGRTKAEVA